MAPTLIQIAGVAGCARVASGRDSRIALLTAFVLWIASHAVRRMEIAYGAEA